jgi:hypothetical protein
MDPLRPKLRKVARRLAIQQWMDYVTLGLLYAMSLACVWLLLTKLFPVLGDPAIVAAGLVAVSVLAFTVLAFLRRPDELTAALSADERLGLNERFTSSLQLEKVEGGMVAALHKDAKRHVASLEPRRDFPFRASRTLRWVSIPVLLFGLGFFLPELDILGHREAVEAAIAKEEKVQMQVERIKEAAKPLREMDEGELDAKVGDVVGMMDALAEDFGRGEINEKQAFARLMNRADELAEQAQTLSANRPVPKLGDDTRQFGDAAEMAKNIQDGNFSEAAAKAKELQKKMAEGDLSDAEKKSMGEDLQKLAQAMASQNPALSEALANAAAAMQAAGNGQKSGQSSQAMAQAMAALQQMEMSLQDMQSVMTQLAQLEAAGQCLGGACQGLGFKPGGKAGIGGTWARGMSNMQGGGMGKGGRGRGGQVGDLPDSSGKFTPSMLPGEMTAGPMLATINQLAKPDGEAESTITTLSGQITQVRQNAEQALAQEEIPAGSKEFVRQYFGTFEADQAAQ